ncbi:MAG: L-threonate 2-dehydrogenase, partial [Burkholderiales bacterium]
MTTQVNRVGVIGLGAMGMGVAQSLLRGGFEVHAFDVRPEVVQKLVESGA